MQLVDWIKIKITFPSYKRHSSMTHWLFYWSQYSWLNRLFSLTIIATGGSLKASSPKNLILKGLTPTPASYSQKAHPTLISLKLFHFKLEVFWSFLYCLRRVRVSVAPDISDRVVLGHSDWLAFRFVFQFSSNVIWSPRTNLSWVIKQTVMFLSEDLFLYRLKNKTA